MSAAHAHAREKARDLALATLGPVLWAAHFLASYSIAAVWCARFAGEDGTLRPVRIAIGVLTAVALGGIAGVAWWGWKRHRHGGTPAPHDDDTPEDRARFLGLTTFLLALLSFIAVVYSAMPAIFLGSCR